MRFSPFIFLLCVGVLGCGSGTEPPETPSASQQAVTECNKGVAFTEREDWPTAIVCYTKAIGLDPDYARAYNRRGFAYFRQRKYDKAIADYTQEIRLDPNEPRAYHIRGIAYEYQGNNAKAEADFAKSEELDNSGHRR
jgi:Tfp pilus assembly protein PilF